MLKGLWVLDFCVQLVLPDLSRGSVLPLNKVQLHLCCDNTACVCTECSVINKVYKNSSKSYRMDNVIYNAYRLHLTSNVYCQFPFASNRPVPDPGPGRGY